MYIIPPLTSMTNSPFIFNVPEGSNLISFQLKDFYSYYFTDIFGILVHESGAVYPIASGARAIENEGMIPKTIDLAYGSDFTDTIWPFSLTDGNQLEFYSANLNWENNAVLPMNLWWDYLTQGQGEGSISGDTYGNFLSIVPDPPNAPILQAPFPPGDYGFYAYDFFSDQSEPSSSISTFIYATSPVIPTASGGLSDNAVAGIVGGALVGFALLGSFL
jgi:hypothetical protein